MTDGTNPVIEPCPKCGWPATAMIDSGTKVWRVYCNDDGTCGDDAPGCRAEGPEAMTEAEAIAAWNTRAAPPANPVIVERVARAIALAWDLDPDVFIGMHGRALWEKQYHAAAQAALEAMPDEVGLREALKRAVEATENLLSADPDMPTYQADYDEAEAAMENGKAALAKVSGVSK